MLGLTTIKSFQYEDVKVATYLPSTSGAKNVEKAVEKKVSF